MDLIRNYSEKSDGDKEDQKPAASASTPSSSSDSSPLRVAFSSKNLRSQRGRHPPRPHRRLQLPPPQAHRPRPPPVAFNPTFDQLWAPIYDPAHPYAKDCIAQGMRNHKLGFVDAAAIHPFLFDEQYNTFHKYGYRRPKVRRRPPRPPEQRRHLRLQHPSAPAEEAQARTQGTDPAEPMATDVENPGSEDWLKKNRKNPWAGKKEGLQSGLTEEQKKYAEEYAEKKAEKEQGGGGGDKPEVADKTTIHGKEDRDYQGGSWIAPPKDAKATNDHCYIPNDGSTHGVATQRASLQSGSSPSMGMSSSQ